MSDAKTDDRILSITRVIKASPEKLFDAWTDPRLLLQWWGPEGTTTPEYAFDVKVGGAWRTVMVDAAGDRRVCSGAYTVLERPNRLAFTWGWLQPDGMRGHETVVDVRLSRVEGGTRMALTQKTFATAAQTGFHNQGWRSSLNKLERMFE